MTTAKPSTALVAAWQRAESVTPEQLAAYEGTPYDVEIADALVAGESSITAIAKYRGVTKQVISAVFADPVRTAWISRQVHARLKNLVGVVDAAIFRRACGGDTAAARLFYERFDIMTAAAAGAAHQHLHLDLRKMSVDDLRSIAADKLRRAGKRVNELLETANEESPTISPDAGD